MRQQVFHVQKKLLGCTREFSSCLCHRKVSAYYSTNFFLSGDAMKVCLTLGETLQLLPGELCIFTHKRI